MIELIEKIFSEYNYSKVTGFGRENIEFYKHENIEIANYFIINSIDCRGFEDNENKVINALEQLENIYSNNAGLSSFSFKQQIMESFSSVKEASQVDKNTSAIYLMRFENIKHLNNYRNALYSLEESPNYFKRYILPYTQEQVERLKNSLSQYEDMSLTNGLCQIIDVDADYFKLVDNQELNSTYSLVIRMFSKLPFLQYKFSSELAPEPIENQIERDLSPKFIGYHHLLNKEEFSIEEMLFIEENHVINEDDLEKEIKKLLKEVAL